MKNEAYRWTGRVQDSHTLQVDQIIEVQPGTEVELTAVPREVGSLEEEHGARWKAWKEFIAMPVSEEDKQFWAELERQVYDTRKRSRWRETAL